MFALHGWQKYDKESTHSAPVLSGIDVLAPEVVAWLMTAAEGIGGLFTH